MFKDGKYYTWSQILAGLAIALLLMLGNYLGSFDSVRGFTNVLTLRLQGDAHQLFRRFQHDDENQKLLRQEIAELRTLSEELESENAELYQKLDDLGSVKEQFEFDLPGKRIPVRVMRLDTNNKGEVHINKGTESGIKEGDVVVRKNFAVGEVVSVIERSSEVILVTSPQSSVPAISFKNKALGIVSGSAEGELIFSDILIDKKVDKNELVATSGLDSNYPRGLILGRVAQVFSAESEPTKQAYLRYDLELRADSNLFVLQR